jgi:DNA-binding GntR family transcriptional regulator
MVKSVEGVYRNGKIELTELPGEVRDDTRVIVTFLETSAVNLQARGIDEAQAAELRAQLVSFAEEWDSPDMALYDNYDVAKARL